MEKNICTNCIHNTDNYCHLFKDNVGNPSGCTAYKEKTKQDNKDFTKKEIQLLIALVEAQKASISLLRGFRSPNRKEQDENAYYNLIINKLKNL